MFSNKEGTKKMLKIFHRIPTSGKDKAGKVDFVQKLVDAGFKFIAFIPQGKSACSGFEFQNGLVAKKEGKRLVPHKVFYRLAPRNQKVATSPTSITRTLKGVMAFRILLEDYNINTELDWVPLSDVLKQLKESDPK